jgi:hypothetical protein
MNHLVSRRRFLTRTTLGTAGFLILRRPDSVRGAAANEKLNLALIGVGGRGSWFLGTMPGLNTRFTALCDVHADRLASAAQDFPEARTYTDFRQMLEEQQDSLDGVIVATPDHTHAVASARALHTGKPVLCEKPLTRTIGEARGLRALAETTGLATQMGNQGTASDAFRRSIEIIQSGALGEIRELLAWNEGGGGGPHPRPTTAQPVPPELNWDLWLGPAADRPYHREWLRWHRWRDFGTGQLGNWAVHSTNLAFKAFRLDTLWRTDLAETQFPQSRRLRVTARMSEVLEDTFPRWELIEFEAPPRERLPTFRMTWCNGRAPGGRERIEEHLGRRLDWGDAGEKKWADYAGLLVVGSHGLLHSTGHNMSFTLHPESDLKGLAGPPRELPRSPGHEREWLEAIRGGPAPWSNFIDHGAGLTEFVLLGNLATRFDHAIEYDPVAGRVTNHEAADRACRPENREGWSW